MARTERRLAREDDCRQRIAWKCSGRRRSLVTAVRQSVLSIGSDRLAVAPQRWPTALEREPSMTRSVGARQNSNDTAAAACYPRQSLRTSIARRPHMRRSIHRRPSLCRACYRLSTLPLFHSTVYVSRLVREGTAENGSNATCLSRTTVHHQPSGKSGVIWPHRGNMHMPGRHILIHSFIAALVRRRSSSPSSNDFCRTRQPRGRPAYQTPEDLRKFRISVAPG